ncbi:MAG: hypothetical protein ACLTYN_11605 [Dysosmobacter welbionis]
MAQACTNDPPYVAVKVPVFSFKKITDANAALSPGDEIYRRGAGPGRQYAGGAVQGLVSAGYKVEKSGHAGLDLREPPGSAGDCQHRPEAG